MKQKKNSREKCFLNRQKKVSFGWNKKSRFDAKGNKKKKNDEKEREKERKRRKKKNKIEIGKRMKAKMKGKERRK